LVISYIPTVYQIHMLNSWQIPIMILAAIGLHDYIIPAILRWQSTLPAQVKGWIIVGCIAVSLPTNLYLWSWRFVDLARHAYSYYLFRDEIIAMKWLKQNTSPGDIVLASETVGQYIPAMSGNTAFLAHWAQTVDYYDKVNRVSRFFNSVTPDADRAKTIRDFHVAYVFFGPAERQLGGYDPTKSPWLYPASSNSKVVIYRVLPDLLPASSP
jgi:uncharacterized membrane protein